MSTLPEPRSRSDARPAAPAERLAELTRALDRERALVIELQETLVHQRAGVASSEAEAVNASVDAIGRLLLALGEARTTRTRIVAALTGDAALPIDRLEAALGAPLPPALETARAALRTAAEGVAHEVAINRAVLRRAVEAGESFLQALFSTAVDSPGVYGTTEHREEPAAGILLNRRA